MSRAVDWAFDAIAGSGLTSPARLVLLVLADHADHDTGDNAYPSMQRIAAYAGLHRSTIGECLRELAADGLIEFDGYGPRGVKRWCLPVPDVGEGDN